MATQCASVIFLEVPAEGSRAIIYINGQRKSTSSVVDVRTDTQRPNWYYIRTSTGSQYAGIYQDATQLSDATQVINAMPTGPPAPIPTVQAVAPPPILPQVQAPTHRSVDTMSIIALGGSILLLLAPFPYFCFLGVRAGSLAVSGSASVGD